MNAHSATAAEKEFPISYLGYPGINIDFKEDYTQYCMKNFAWR
jgi:hypothetical protein